jgi:hypothetical protein
MTQPCAAVVYQASVRRAKARLAGVRNPENLD